MHARIPHKVQVWDTWFDVDVYQRKKTVWEAVGTYKGLTIRGKGTSLNTAGRSWGNIVRFIGNNTDIG